MQVPPFHLDWDECIQGYDGPKVPEQIKAQMRALDYQHALLCQRLPQVMRMPNYRYLIKQIEEQVEALHGQLDDVCQPLYYEALSYLDHFWECRWFGYMNVVERTEDQWAAARGR